MESNTLQAKDLRLNNLIYFSDESKNVKNALATVKGIEDDEMVKFTAKNVTDNSTETRISISQNTIEGWGEMRQFTPIPIDEDWLLKAGFEATTAGYWSNEKLEIGYTTSDENIQYEYISITHKTEMKDLKFVHQLQNLYFALTSEELTISL